MTAQQMKQLTANIRRDGKLTSLPLVFERPDGALEILSGHHRTQAAIEAGLAVIDVLVVKGDLDEKRLTAIQLSHNAITGQDDRSMLASLYDGLDLDDRKYSGLTDDLLGGFDLKMVGMGVGAITYEELRINFLPEDAEEFRKCLKRIETHAKKRDALVAHYADFDRFFETLLAIKQGLNIHNAAIALRFMADLAAEQLSTMEMGDAHQQETGDAGHEENPDPSTPAGTINNRQRGSGIARSGRDTGSRGAKATG